MADSKVVNPDKVILMFDPCDCGGYEEDNISNELVSQTLTGVLDSGTAACPYCGGDLTFSHVLVED